jgi:hypothetical protein
MPCAARRGQDVIEVGHPERNHGSAHPIGSHVPVVDDDHAFSSTCHKYSSPMTSSAGRPKKSENHSSDLVRSVTGMMLYKSTRLTLAVVSPLDVQTLAVTETHRRRSRSPYKTKRCVDDYLLFN